MRGAVPEWRCGALDKCRAWRAERQQLSTRLRIAAKGPRMENAPVQQR